MIVGSREQLNTITSFVDGSNIYSSHENGTKTLRTMSGTGGIVLTISHDKCTVYYAKNENYAHINFSVSIKLKRIVKFNRT